MNIVVSKTAAKLSVAFVAVAMLFTLAMPAQAQTLEELQEMIATLQAQIAALTGGGDSSSCPALTQPMTIGSEGQNVVALQNYLTSTGHFTFSGGSTGYFGSITQSAVASWQAANGVSPAAGYWGPVSLAKYNAVCTTSGSGDNGGGMSGDLQGGAGDIDVDQISSGVEDEVLEGEDDVEVLGFEVEADDSDVELTNVEVQFAHEGSGSDNLSRYIDEVTIWLDGEMVGSADVDEFDEDDDVYSENVSLDDAVIREGDTERMYVAVTAEGNIDSDDLSQTWEVAITDIRFRDGSGAVLTDGGRTGATVASGNGSVAEDFTFEDLASSGDIELTVSEDDDDINDAHTVPVDDSSDTNDVAILSFTLDADGSDITVEGLTFDVTSSGAGVTEIANEFRLLMDGEEVGDVAVDIDDDGTNDTFASSSDAAIEVNLTNLDDDDVVIEEGEEVSFTLVADINDIDGGFTNGASLSASLSGVAADVDAEDENGDSLTNSELSGSADSSTIGFASSGIMVKMTDSSASQILGLDSTSTDDQGKYTVEFEVTAFEDTAYVELEAASSTTADPGDYGVAFNVETTANATVADGTNNASLEYVGGQGTVSGSFVRINAGQTAKFRLTVYYNPASTGLYRVQMNAVGYAATAIAATAQQATVPVEDYQSASIQVQN